VLPSSFACVACAERCWATFARRIATKEQELAESESLTLTVSEAAMVLGISRTTAYECVRSGQLRAVRLGRRLVVPRVAIVELLAAPARSVPSTDVDGVSSPASSSSSPTGQSAVSA